MEIKKIMGNLEGREFLGRFWLKSEFREWKGVVGEERAPTESASLPDSRCYRESWDLDGNLRLRESTFRCWGI